MTQHLAGTGSVSASARSFAATRRLLVCGLLAGPLFVSVTAIEVLTRTGFDLRRNGISQLSLGDPGWIQVANFIVAGLLSIAFAVGVRRVLAPGFGMTWAPALIVGYGIGLVVTGVFVVDPGVGFPPGTEEGLPAELSWHGAVHALAPPLAFVLLVGVCGVFAVRSSLRRQWALSAYSGGTGVVAVMLIFWPAGGGSVRSAVAVVLTSAWMTVVAAALIAELNGRNQRRARRS